MSISTIRAGIKSRLETVSGINKVLDYVVWTDNWETIYSLFAEGTERVNVWMVGLASSPVPAISRELRQRPYSFNIIGYYSIKTENQTSKTFEDLIGAILNAFDSKTSIAAGSEITVHPAVNLVANTMYAQHPCHTVTIGITIMDREEMADVCG